MSDKEASKKAAKELLELCKKEGVKVPTNPMNAMIEAGTMLRATRENGEFHMQNALEEMIKKFGQDKPVAKSPTKKRKASAVKKEDAKSKSKKSTTDEKSAEEDEEEEEPTPKKAKKERAKPKATCEDNQALADAFAELSSFEFKRGERFKGGTWSKVAKAIRDHDEAIKNGKQALKLKGIGKSSASMIDEFLETGTLEKLEEFRAGCTNQELPGFDLNGSARIGLGGSYLPQESDSRVASWVDSRQSTRTRHWHPL